MPISRKPSSGGESPSLKSIQTEIRPTHVYERKPIEMPKDWPALGEQAFHGPAGKLVKAIAPYTEADPAGVLLQLLVMAGVLVGRRPYMKIGSDSFRANLMCVLVGASGSGRKGTSGRVARSLLCDKGSIIHIGGLASGEALIDALASRPAAKGLILEEEYARWLKAAGRTGSTLSETARVLYDGEPLSRRTTELGEQLVTDYHVSVIGHCTPMEFVATLSEIDQSNGAVNRLLIFPVASRQRIFFNDDDGTVAVPTPLLPRKRTLAQVAIKASSRQRINWTDNAWVRARDLYFSEIMFHPSPLLARQWTNFGRLILIYALLDESEKIEVEHVEAAEAIIRYSRAGVQQLFKRAPRPAFAEEILRHVLCRGANGISLTELTREFSNHVEIAKRNAVLTGLLSDGLILREKRLTSGRPMEWLVGSEFVAKRPRSRDANKANKAN